MGAAAIKVMQQRMNCFFITDSLSYRLAYVEVGKTFIRRSSFFSAMPFIHQRPVAASRRHLKLKCVKRRRDSLDGKSLFNRLTADLALPRPNLCVAVFRSLHDFNLSPSIVGGVSKNFLRLVVSDDRKLSPLLSLVRARKEKKTAGQPLQAFGRLELLPTRTKWTCFGLSGKLPIPGVIIALLLQVRARFVGRL